MWATQPNRHAGTATPIDADIFRVPVGPGTLHVERYGFGGPAVVLIHGFATSSFLWRRLGPMLAVEGHRVFAIDLLGYGESDRPFDAEYGIRAQAEYVDRALTALRLSSASVLLVLRDTWRERQPATGSHSLLMAMGPGFCSEMVLLEW